jgi:hypothetical protein
MLPQMQDPPTVYAQLGSVTQLSTKQVSPEEQSAFVEHVGRRQPSRLKVETPPHSAPQLSARV